MEIGIPYKTYNGTLIHDGQQIATDAATSAEYATVVQINLYLLANPNTTPAQLPTQMFKDLFKRYYIDSLNTVLSQEYYGFNNVNVATVSYDNSSFTVKIKTNTEP